MHLHPIQTIDISLIDKPAGRLPKVTCLDIERARNNLPDLTPIIVAPVPLSRTVRYLAIDNLSSYVIAALLEMKKVPVYIRPSGRYRSQPRPPPSRRGPGKYAEDPITLAKLIRSTLQNGRAFFGSKDPPTLSQISLEEGMALSTVSNLLRLLKLPRQVQRLVQDRRLAIGKALPLLSLVRRSRGETERYQIQMANDFVNRKRSARVCESLVRGKSGKDSDVLRLESRLSDHLGCPVEISDGKLILDFEGNLDVFEGLKDKLNYRE